MKVLIVSDTHGRRGELEEIIELEKPFQFLIHCGDVEGDEEYMKDFQNQTPHWGGGEERNKCKYCMIYSEDLY